MEDMIDVDEATEVDEKKSFSERLNIALDIAGIPQKGKGRQLQVAGLFGVSQESARKWLAGKSFPDTKRIPEIAKKLKVNAQWLLSGVGSINPIHTAQEYMSEPFSSLWIKVPILSWEEAGKWETVLASKSMNEEDDFAWSETEVGVHAYALVVGDNSMLPRYEPACILIVDPDYQAQDKHSVVYLLENEKKATCRQLIVAGDGHYLKSHHPGDRIYTIKEKDKYCGAVRQACVVY